MAHHASTSPPAVRRRRRVARRPPTIWGAGALQDAGAMAFLAGQVVRGLLSPPYPWWRDCVVEISLAIRRCIGPLVISMIAFAVGIGALFVGQIIASLGTVDRLSGGLVLAFTREPSVWVTAMIFAGIAGSAMTADLGARRIREELDAFEVLGVDTLKALVVPRVVAMVIVAPILGMICLLTSQVVLTLLLPIFYPTLTLGSELETMRSFLYSTDFVILCVKLPLVGAFVGVVSCYKGLSTAGGAEGVGRAVNQAVVLMFLGLWLLNSVVNVAYLAAFSSLTELRG